MSDRNIEDDEVMNKEQGAETNVGTSEEKGREEPRVWDFREDTGSKTAGDRVNKAEGGDDAA
ncbi:MAG: hypothetical protein J6Z35_04070, partial [Lachnospiraceae bacterium]|nr:hypothetical protein [Lachnospiraceae bacterium]